MKAVMLAAQTIMAGATCRHKTSMAAAHGRMSSTAVQSIQVLYK
jgi:hypothetical protein